MEETLDRIPEQQVFMDFARRLQEIVMTRNTCTICGTTNGICDAVVHAGYNAMVAEELDDALADIKNGTASFVSADEVFHDLPSLMEEIRNDNQTMPLGKLLAETLDFIANGYISYSQRKKIHVAGRRYRKSVTYVYCSVCTASQTLDEYDHGVALQHDAYCIVPQARTLVLRLLERATEMLNS